VRVVPLELPSTIWKALAARIGPCEQGRVDAIAYLLLAVG
jgi:hypothetical protein